VPQLQFMTLSVSNGAWSQEQCFFSQTRVSFHHHTTQHELNRDRYKHSRDYIRPSQDRKRSGKPHLRSPRCQAHSGKGGEGEMAAVHRQGQRHDRIPPPPGNGDLDQPSAPKLVRPADSDVSISQKMLSAVTGSILTSLLGMSLGCLVVNDFLCQLLTAQQSRP